MGMLDLPDGPRTQVWRRTTSILMSDEVLRRTIQTWIVWDGSKLGTALDMTSMAPLVRLTPTIGPMQWYSPDAMYGPLVVSILIGVQSRDISDLMNLWDAFELALYPRNDRFGQLAIQQSLRDVGAETGLWEFSIPPIDPDPRANEDAVFCAEGKMRISIIRPFNP